MLHYGDAINNHAELYGSISQVMSRPSIVQPCYSPVKYLAPQHACCLTVMRSISLRPRERWRPSRLIFTKEVLYIMSINCNENTIDYEKQRETKRERERGILQVCTKYKFSLFCLNRIKIPKEQYFSNRLWSLRMILY